MSKSENFTDSPSNSKGINVLLYDKSKFGYLNLHYLAAILGVSLWGTTFAISKLLVPNKLDPITFTAIRSIIGFLFLFFFILVTKQFKIWLDLLKREGTTIFLIGFVLYAASYLVQYWGISYTKASNQAIISNTQTFWVVLFNTLFFKQRPNKRFIIGSFGAFIGIILVILNDNFSVNIETIKGDLISILAFALWGSYTAFSKPISARENSLLVTSGFIFFANFLLIPVTFFSGGFEKLVLLSSNDWLILFYLGVVCIGITFILWTFALSSQTVPSEKIAIITMLNPIIGVIFSVIVLNEVLTLRMVIGMVIVFISLYYAESASKK